MRCPAKSLFLTATIILLLDEHQNKMPDDLLNRQFCVLECRTGLVSGHINEWQIYSKYAKPCTCFYFIDLDQEWRQKTNS